MKYIFKILIYTDNEFSIPYVPAGMTFDWDKTYSLTKEYSDIVYAIADIEDICLFLRQNIRSEYCFVDDYWAGLIDEFLKKVDKIKNVPGTCVSESLDDNLAPTEFSFCIEAV